MRGLAADEEFRIAAYERTRFMGDDAARNSSVQQVVPISAVNPASPKFQPYIIPRVERHTVEVIA